MRVLVLGGCGIQGRAAVYDLAKSPAVSEVLCADARPVEMLLFKNDPPANKVRFEALDASDETQLAGLMGRADAAIDLLPRQFMPVVCQAAIAAGVSVVNTNYAYDIAHLDAAARQAGIAIAPECGLDPGIDLVLCAEMARRFDRLEVMNAYCGGIPEPAACDNPLNYKISWNWEGVLASTMRPARQIQAGHVIEITAADQHARRHIHTVEFPGLGTLEAIPNGDALFFARQMGVDETIRQAGRYSLRWPGWSAFWHPLKMLGFLDQSPISDLPGKVSGYDVMHRLLAPQLHYRDDEKDLVVMLNVFEGQQAQRTIRVTTTLRIERDLDSGLLAMSQAVGFTASIVAQMIATKQIDATGVLSPTRDIPYQAFVDALDQRGIRIDHTEQVLA
jgi:saccharopine dehydrogenase-like NADP-dependent oxidoreductase